MNTANYMFTSDEALETRGLLRTWDAIGAFVFAGNATFTLRSVKTGERFTYRVRLAGAGKAADVEATKRKREAFGTAFFVSLLRGPSNEDDFAYLGLIDNRGFHRTTKSRVGEDASSHKAFAFFFCRMQTGGAPCATLEVWHEGRCGRCGRKLTVPESVERGIGPECAGRME